MVQDVILLELLPTPTLYKSQDAQNCQVIYRIYLDRSFFFRRSPSASEISCSVTVYVYFSPFSKAILACVQQAMCFV